MFECKISKDEATLFVDGEDNAELMQELIYLNCIMLSKMADMAGADVGRYKTILTGMINSVSDEFLSELHTLGQEADGDA